MNNEKTADAPPRKLSPRALRRADFLDEIKKIVCQDRNSQHGEAEDNFQTIAEFWNTFLTRRHGFSGRITSLDVADMMVLFKIARVAANPLHGDTRKDIGGYAACGAGIAMEKSHYEDADPDLVPMGVKQ